MDPKPVRTYLDPDSVGPLPRAMVADDSDEMAAARTIVRLPDAPTEEIRSTDVLEVVDPNRRPPSLAPVGYDTSELFFAPRRHLAKYVVGTVAVAFVLLVVAITRSLSAPSPQPAPVAVRGPVAPPALVAAAAAVAPAADPRPTADVTVGTLRIDGSVEGQRVYVDGVALTASAAMLRCGPHELAVGSPTRARTVDVPCGGEVTVFR